MLNCTRCNTSPSFFPLPPLESLKYFGRKNNTLPELTVPGHNLGSLVRRYFSSANHLYLRNVPNKEICHLLLCADPELLESRKCILFLDPDS